MDNFEKIVLIFFASNYLIYISFHQFWVILKMTMKKMRYHLVKNKEVWVPVQTVDQQSMAYHLESLNLRFFFKIWTTWKQNSIPSKVIKYFDPLALRVGQEIYIYIFNFLLMLLIHSQVRDNWYSFIFRFLNWVILGFKLWG